MNTRKLSAIDVGLLVIRLGLGVMFIMHGWPKMMGGPEKWAGLGGAMGTLGIAFAPAFWGFMAAFAELVGGAMLIVGLLVRPFAAMMFFTMFVAAFMHITGEHGFYKWAWPVEVGVAFLGLTIAGGGRLALGATLAPFKDHWFR